MKILIEPDLSAYTEDQLEEDLRRIPGQRREKAMRYRFVGDRKRCVRAYTLLEEGLRAEYGMQSVPAFGFGPKGKPYLENFPEIHFSLSHTENAVLCVISSRPVGADIEKVRTKELERLASKCFSEMEQNEVRASDAPGLAFTKLWTRKESFLKFTGQGLTGTAELRNVPTRDNGEVCFFTRTGTDEGFVYSVCRAADDGEVFDR